MEDLKIENVDIPIKTDGIILKGSIYFSSNTPLKAPWIINLPGYPEDRESYFVRYYSDKFARAGYYVLSYDYRGLGKTIIKIGKRKVRTFNVLPQVFSDICEVLGWILDNQTNRLLNNEIILFGRSFGGAIILTHGYVDVRAKILIPLCTRYSYESIGPIKFSEEDYKQISPKFFLKKDPSNNKRILIAHCKDDDRIPFENVKHIKEHLRLKDENVIVYETGGHSFKGHRDDIFDRATDFIKRRL